MNDLDRMDIVDRSFRDWLATLCRDHRALWEQGPAFAGFKAGAAAEQGRHEQLEAETRAATVRERERLWKEATEAERERWEKEANALLLTTGEGEAYDLVVKARDHGEIWNAAIRELLRRRGEEKPAAATPWSTEWPTEPGFYWFLGRCWSSSEDELHFVQVRHGAGKAPFYVTNGHFVYKSEGATGLWRPAELPELPAGAG